MKREICLTISYVWTNEWLAHTSIEESQMQIYRDTLSTERKKINELRIYRTKN
jgi:hypothetical protein